MKQRYLFSIILPDGKTKWIEILAKNEKIAAHNMRLQFPGAKISEPSELP